MLTRRPVLVFWLLLLNVVPAEATFDSSFSLEGIFRRAEKHDDRVGGEATAEATYSFGSGSDSAFAAFEGTQRATTLHLKSRLDYRAEQDRGHEVLYKQDVLGISVPLGSKNTIFAGRNILIWGKGDEINPTDVVNSEDLSYFIAEDKEYRKRGRAMLLHTWEDGNFKLQTLITPYGDNGEHKYRDLNNPWCYLDCALLQPEFIKTQLAAAGITGNFPKDETETWTLFEGASRLTYSTGDVDFALMGFSGFELIPIFARSFLGPAELEFKRSHHRISSVGGDLAFTLGAFVLRLEGRAIFGTKAPYKFTSSEFVSSENGLKKFNEAEVLLGVDLNFPWNIFMNVQYYKRMAFTDTANLTLLQGRQLATVTLRKSFLSEKGRVEYRTVVDLDHTAFVHNPEVVYEFWENFESRLGAMWLHGEELSPFGQLNDNSNVYLGAKYTF